jgi:type I restriction enzyme S subunit
MRDGWRETSLGDIAEVIGGGTPSTAIAEYWDGGIVWLTPTEITSQDGKVVSDSIRKITDLGFKNSGAQMLPRDSVILTSRASVGYVALAGKDLCTNQGFQSLIPKQYVLAKFLMFWIQQNRPEFESRSAGSTFKEISKSNVKSIKLQLPPLSEQKRIVDLISSVDSYIEALQRQLESAKKSRNAVLHEILQAGGDDWVEGKVGDISVLRYGYTESANWDPIGPKFLRITDIQDGQVNWDLVPYCKISDADLGLQQLKDGDLVFARTGATTGKSFLVTNPPDSVSASYLIRLRPDQSKVNPYYLSIFFQSENYWQQVMAGTSGSAQGGVNASKLSHLKIQIPPLSRQKMISDLIEEMDIHASKIRDSLNRSQDLRNSMLSDLLSGEHQIPASYDKVIGAA